MLIYYIKNEPQKTLIKKQNESFNKLEVFLRGADPVVVYVESVAAGQLEV